MNMTTAKTHTVTHTSLYRTYRPSNFKEVVGQEHIVSVLETEIEQNKISHAYLFCGSRGTGKTSVARIFAKALGTSQNDLYEIDAASNTSVDDIRELSEAVHTVPFESKYKVYILDEVHMLSKAAFNAFLKTLEEPPKHVIFILATTEMEKLPDTIVSRCESYVFKKPTPEMLKKHIVNISKKELAASGQELESAAAELIAVLGDGSFRDTLSILQKVLTFYSGSDDKEKGNKITLSDVEKITGAPKASIVLGFVSGLLLKQSADALTSLQHAVSENVDIKVFAKLAMMRLRYALLTSINKDSIGRSGGVGQGAGNNTSQGGIAEILGSDISENDKAVIDELVKTVAISHIANTLKSILNSYQIVGKSHIASLPLEILVVDVCGSEKV